MIKNTRYTNTYS